MKILYTLCLFWFVFVWISPGARAAEKELPSSATEYLQDSLAIQSRGPMTDMKLPNIFEVMVRFFFSLLLLTVIIAAGVYVYKKFFAAQYMGKPTSLISVLEHRYLDPKKSIYLLEIGQKILVVGASAEKLSVLSEISDPEELRHIYALRENKETALGTRTFKKVLSGVEEKAKSVDETKEDAPSHQTMASLRSQLQRIKRMINES